MKSTGFLRQGQRAFTLVELLVAMVVLVGMLTLILSLFNNASATINLGHKQMDCDQQARALLDRMGLDLAGMAKRSDVDYYLKGRPQSNTQNWSSGDGNDELVFYSEVPGYGDVTTNPTPAFSATSLVAYRLYSPTPVNGASRQFVMQRLSKGLYYNGAAPDQTPAVFLPIPLVSPFPDPLPSPVPSAFPDPAPSPAWQKAFDPSTSPADQDWEVTGPQVFRFEYYYVLKGFIDASGTQEPSILSSTPFDTRQNHTFWDGINDVAAVGVSIAVIDQKSRLAVTDDQLYAFSKTLLDFGDSKAAGSNGLHAGDLESGWQAALITAMASSPPTLSKPAGSGIHFYSRLFYLNSPSS